MRHSPLRAWAALALLMYSAPVFATEVPSSSRDGSLQSLQRKMDRLVGPGHVNVRTDFIGARPGDPDPWFWINNGAHAVAVTLIDRESPHGRIGWYEETGVVPVIDGVGDGVILDNLRARGDRMAVRLPASVRAFGFYIERPAHRKNRDEGPPITLFTNRRLNPSYLRGEDSDPVYADREAQVLVYDVSRWLGMDTWLVVRLYSESEGRADGEDDDDDEADVLFTVTAQGPTATRTMTFSRVKSMFR